VQDFSVLGAAQSEGETILRVGAPNKLISPLSSPHHLAALTIARMPVRIAWGNSGHASTTAARFGSATTYRVVAISVAVGVQDRPG